MSILSIYLEFQGCNLPNLGRYFEYLETFFCQQPLGKLLSLCNIPLHDLWGHQFVDHRPWEETNISLVQKFEPKILDISRGPSFDTMHVFKQLYKTFAYASHR